MKKRLLLVPLMAASLGASAQSFNWLSNGDFETEGKTLETVTNAAEPEKGDWASFVNKDYVDKGYVCELTTDEGHGNVAQLTGVGGVSWFRGYLMQNVPYTLKPEEYTLTFDIKAVGSNVNVSTWVYMNNGNLYGFKAGFDETATPGASAARYDFTATTEWQTVTAKFDFTYTCNNINSPGNTASWAKAEATAAALADARVVFNTNAKAGTFMIDNISLVAVNPDTRPDGTEPDPDPDPEPDPDPVVPADPEFPAYVEVTADGNYLEDGGFDIEDIQVWRTLNKGKYLGDLGHWYFYNEDKDGVDPYASTAVIQDAGDSHGNVVALVNEAKISSWWAHDLVQRIGVKLQPMTYRLSFYVRSNSGATGKCHIALKGKEVEKATAYALLDGFVPADHPLSTGTTPNFKGTTDWQLVEYVFDLSHMAETIWSPTSGASTDEEKNEGIANYIKDVTDEEFWENAYVCIWNETANSTLEVDDVIFEPIDTYMEIQNPSFETNTLLPVLSASEPALGARSGQWVVVNKRGGVMNLSIDDEDAFDGQRSMKLETVTLASYPRMDQYMAMDLYEVPAGKYTFKFAAKASQDAAPIRVDIYSYSDYESTAFLSATGENGDVWVEDTNTGNGLKVFNASTNWVEYSQPVNIEENVLVRLIIRPNIKATNNTGVPDNYELPVTHWFDNFSFGKDEHGSGIEAAQAGAVRIYAADNTVCLEGLDNSTVAIYSVNGALVDYMEKANGTVARTLAKGSYVVKAVSAEATQVVKVLVK